MVAKTFIQYEGEDEPKYVLHKDSNYENIHYTNLIWSDSPEIQEDEFFIIPGFSNYRINRKSVVKSYFNGIPLVMKIQTNEHGYKTIKLTDDKGKARNMYLYRLNALTFHENPDNLPFVDHIDRDKSNNNTENLRWVTPTENSLNRTYVKQDKSKEIYEYKEGEIGVEIIGLFSDRHIYYPSYKITNYGNVINLYGIRLKPKDSSICPVYNLSHEGKKEEFMAHILVARFFVKGRTREKIWVNHIDEDRRNPRADNLEWVTPSENSLHSAHKKRRPVAKIDLRTGKILQTYISMIEAARDLSEDKNKHDNIVSSISKCCNGIRKSGYDYGWKFIEK